MIPWVRLHMFNLNICLNYGVIPRPSLRPLVCRFLISPESTLTLVLPFHFFHFMSISKCLIFNYLSMLQTIITLLAPRWFNSAEVSFSFNGGWRMMPQPDVYRSDRWVIEITGDLTISGLGKRRKSDHSASACIYLNKCYDDLTYFNSTVEGQILDIESSF